MEKTIPGPGMEALLEQLCARLGPTASPGGSVDELLVQIKHLTSKRHASSGLSPDSARRFFDRVCQVSPCLEEALPVLVHSLLLLHPRQQPSSLEEALELLQVPEGVPLDVLGWLRLTLLRILGDRLEFCPDVLSGLRAWGLFDAPTALAILPAKQGLFRARLMEACVPVLNRAPVRDCLAGDEAFCAWLFGSLFSNDDLVLQKARELTVAVLLRTRSPALFARLLALPAGMKIRYQLVTQLLDASQQARRRGEPCPLWPVPSSFLQEAKLRASTERGLAPAACDALTAIMLSGCASAEGHVASSMGPSILAFLMEPSESYRPQLAKYLLPRLIAVWPQLVKDLAASYQPASGCQAGLETRVLLLLTVATEFGGLPDCPADAALLTRAMASGSEEIRLGAFGCLCRAFGPARPADPRHLALLSTFLRHLSLESTANLRQKALVSLQALFNSLLSRLYTLLRRSGDSEDSECHLLLDWLRALLHAQMDCLDAPHRHQFGCVDLALRLLLDLHKALRARQQSKGHRTATPTDSALEAAMASVIQDTILARGHLLFETVLENSFDSSRRMAAQLATAFAVPRDEQHLRHEAMRRLRSPREALAAGAALILLHGDSREDSRKAGREDSMDHTSHTTGHTTGNDSYLDLLEAQLEHVHRDISTAAAEDNLNGTLALLALLLEQRRLEPSQRLCDLAMAVGHAVAAMASQASPEGAELVPEAERATSQLILTFSWRAIKESTYIWIFIFIL